MLLNSSKKKVHFTKESRAFDLEEYLTKNISEVCIVHGVSSVLKTFQMVPHIIFTHQLNTEELLACFQKHEMEQLHKDLERDLEMIKNPKTTHRLVFGKDISHKIQERGLMTLYCSPDMHQKVMTRVPKEMLSDKFHVHKIETLTKGDIGDKLKQDFSGLVGVTYY